MQFISIVQSLTVVSLGSSSRSRFAFYWVNYNAIGYSSLELELIQERSIFFLHEKKRQNFEQESQSTTATANEKYAILSSTNKPRLSCALLQLTYELREKLLKKSGGSEFLIAFSVVPCIIRHYVHPLNST